MIEGNSYKRTQLCIIVKWGKEYLSLENMAWVLAHMMYYIYWQKLRFREFNHFLHFYTADSLETQGINSALADFIYPLQDGNFAQPKIRCDGTRGSKHEDTYSKNKGHVKTNERETEQENVP